MWEQLPDIVKRAYCWEVLPICTELFIKKTIQLCIKILLKTNYHIIKTISQYLNHFSFLLCFLKHLHNTPLEEQNLARVVYFKMSLNMSSSAMFERALNVSFRSQRREKTPIPLAWLYNNQERSFFSASSVMLHITWVHWVSVSIVPVKDAPKKNPAFLSSRQRNGSIHNAPVRISLCNYLRSHYQTAALPNLINN